MPKKRQGIRERERKNRKLLEKIALGEKEEKVLRVEVKSKKIKRGRKG